MRRHCTANRQDGSPCSAWAQRGSEPPRCVAHRTESPAERYVNLAGQITELGARIEQLLDCMDERFASGVEDRAAAREYRAFLTLYSNLLGRLGRLMRDQRAISGEAADGIAGAIAQALDELSTELGADL